MDVQNNIESVVEKRSREVFGPPPGKKLIVFIDDMNMPMVDTYGTQQPIALLKLLFERGGFYDRGRDLNWKYMKDICEYCHNVPKIILLFFAILIHFFFGNLIKCYFFSLFYPI